MYILGINDGHNGTVALLKDGKIIHCISEERFSRIKNHVGFPFKGVKYILKSEKITPNELAKIVITKNSGLKIEKNGRVFNSFLVGYSNKSKMKKIFSYLIYKFPNLFEPFINFKQIVYNNKKQKKVEEDNKKKLLKIYNIPKKKIIYKDHHLLHALSTCFNLPKNKKSLIFTLDAEGSGENNEHLCATVSVFDGKNLKRISKTEKRASLGYLYGLTTLYLGMKPNEHEFKVMGMAPYAKKKNVEKDYEIFKKILWVEELKFKSKFRMQYADSYLKEKALYKRFDNISGAVQKLTEDLTVEWIKNGIKKTGIKTIGLSGGVFMNVKANKKIAELPEVEEIFPMPSSGDECTAIGACFWGYKKYCEENDKKFNPQPIKDLYLGPEYSDEEIRWFLEENKYFKKYKIETLKNIEKEIAKLLLQNQVVARFKGRSEWGARALGNRSLLANPSSRESIKILNELIKDRDFWMPFTPSILEEDIEEYIFNPKKIPNPYMTITFDSTKKAQKEIPAAMHPYDMTVRPQAVSKNWNSEYHKLISEFKKLSGTGAVLNTSFNLHGEPNVLSPKDAIHTLENSSLKYLALGNYLVCKELI